MIKSAKGPESGAMAQEIRSSVSIGEPKGLLRFCSNLRFAAIILAGFVLSLLQARPIEDETEKRYKETLQKIYAEVVEFGPYRGEDFIRRDFFVGEDEDDTNKDIHVVILIQVWEGREYMTIQVTEMERIPDNPRVARAKKTRSVRYLMSGAEAEADRSEFSRDELQKLTPEVLRAILNKKRLLK
ncbi:MAG: hypothetical protein AB1715_00255 [Acidobacteriota bacterium]